jgi:hypothetical protein
MPTASPERLSIQPPEPDALNGKPVLFKDDIIAPNRKIEWN